jgi:methyl-accepting chemotaxis protein
MDKVVQQNAATAEESASASEEMNAQAEQMKSVARNLNGMITGGGVSPAQVPGVSTQAAKPVDRPADTADKAADSRPRPAEEIIPMGDQDCFQDF